jgi:hypothetical protein
MGVPAEGTRNVRRGWGEGRRHEQRMKVLDRDHPFFLAPRKFRKFRKFDTFRPVR